MNDRNFVEWLSMFRTSISGYEYYIDFKKVINNVAQVKVEIEDKYVFDAMQHIYSIDDLEHGIIEKVFR